MTLGELLKSMRQQMSMGLNQLALKSGVSASQISRIENDEQKNPTIDTVKKLSAALNDTDKKLLKMMIFSDFKLEGTPKVTGNITDTVPIPNLSARVNVYGSIRAGSPTFAEQEIIGNVSVSDKVEKRYGKENLFALMVKGNSMNLKVLPGYVAIFAKDTEIENGDTVAVLIDGEDATIKNYRKTSVAVMFEPQSNDPTFQPIVFPKTGIQDFRILGKMVYVVSGEYI